MKEMEGKDYNMKSELSHQILKKLVFEYKETKDKTIFLKILKRIDNLIVHTVNKYITRRPQFQSMDYYQDFYHSAIVGVYKGIDSAKESESGSKLQARLIAYMKAEIRNFCENPEEKKIILSVYRDKDKVVPEETVYQSLEQEFLRERYQKLISDNVITLEEIQLLCMKFVDNYKMKALMVKTGHSDNWIRKKIKSIFKRIQVYLINRKLEDM